MTPSDAYRELRDALELLELLRGAVDVTGDAPEDAGLRAAYAKARAQAQEAAREWAK